MKGQGAVSLVDFWVKRIFWNKDEMDDQQYDQVIMIQIMSEVAKFKPGKQKKKNYRRSSYFIVGQNQYTTKNHDCV
jgi:hypothetical protein